MYLLDSPFQRAPKKLMLYNYLRSAVCFFSTGQHIAEQEEWPALKLHP